MIGKIIGFMFLSRDVAHRQHLATKSYAEHCALGSFYLEIVEKADLLAETYQGLGELLDSIPYMENDKEGDVEGVLRRHLALIMKHKGHTTKWEGAIEAIFDEIEILYLSTLYKLKFLR